MPTIAGTTLQSVLITLTLPTTRTDGTAAALSEIASSTILRDPGTGPATLTVINGPYASGTVTYTDASPATGSDIYSFYCTDTAGTQGQTSPPVSVAINGATPLAPLSAGTLTAVAQSPAGSGVSVTPATVSLAPSATQTFTANQPVTWSAGIGAINSSGLYTAPASDGTDTVVATSTATPPVTGSATVTIAATIQTQSAARKA
jgi:hypothetical protein